MAKRTNQPESPLEKAQSAAAEVSLVVDIREQDGALIYSVGETDLLARPLGNPGVYKLLVDHPATEGKKGQTKQLTAPFDEQCACTARDLANTL